MPQENVDLVHRYIAALNAREVPEGLLAPDFVMVNAVTAVTDGTYHDAAGVIQWTSDIFEALDAESYVFVDRIAADQDGDVVAMVGIDGTTALARLEFKIHWAAVFSCRHGALTKVVGYLQLGEALEAVGLEG